jgi:hypothetical protein
MLYWHSVVSVRNTRKKLISSEFTARLLEEHNQIEEAVNGTVPCFFQYDQPRNADVANGKVKSV